MRAVFFLKYATRKVQNLLVHEIRRQVCYLHAAEFNEI